MEEVITPSPGSILARRMGCSCPKPQYEAVMPEVPTYAGLCPLHNPSVEEDGEAEA